MYISPAYIHSRSFKDIDRGRSRYQFFLFLSDYLDEQTEAFRALNPYLERFARRLGTTADLVRPFTGDIEATRDDVLTKTWSEDELREILRAPCLLMIDLPFSSFDPKKHSWVIIHLASRANVGSAGTREVGELLEKLAAAVAESKENAFEAAQAVLHEVTPSEAARIFEAKPGIFGFSIDLFEGAKFIHKLYRRLAGQ